MSTLPPTLAKGMYMLRAEGLWLVRRVKAPHGEGCAGHVPECPALPPAHAGHVERTHRSIAMSGFVRKCPDARRGMLNEPTRYGLMSANVRFCPDLRGCDDEFTERTTT